MPRLLPFVLLVALAGCLASPANDDDGLVFTGRPADPGQPSSWSRDECDPSGATDIGRTAPLIDPLRGSPLAVARRFADAMSTPLTSEAPDAQGASLVRWNTTRGYVSYETASDSDRRHAGTLAGLRWGADYTWPGGATADERERNLETFLARFGVPAHVELWLKATTARTVQFHQEHDGTGVHFTQGYADGGSNFASETGFYTEVSVGPLFDLSGVDVAPSPESASQTAQDYLRCVLGRDGKTEANGYRQTTVQPPGFAVVNESLAWNFHIAFTEPGERSHCGFSRQVYVDVTTGAVHGWDWPYCD